MYQCPINYFVDNLILMQMAAAGRHIDYMVSIMIISARKGRLISSCSWRDYLWV